MSASERAEEFARAADRRPLIVFAALTVLYILACASTGNRPLWHDELYTFYIANAVTLHRGLEELLAFDMNPPLIHLLVRASNAMFGMSPAATRLPSMLAFYAACAFLFVYLRRKIGALYAAAGLLLFWAGPFFMYAVEARPYALLLCFFSLSLLSYDTALTSATRGAALAGIAAGTLGMIASHAFSPLSIFPFLFAEAVRFYRNRKLDFALWAALVLPLGAMTLYIPLVRDFQSVLFPIAFQPSLLTPLRFYVTVATWSASAVLGATLASLAVASPGPTERLRGNWKGSDASVTIALLMAPVLLTPILIRAHGAFWDRYCITSGLAAAFLFVAWLAERFSGNRTAALATAIVVAGVVLKAQVIHPLAKARREPRTAAALEQVRPELPLVCASGVTFFEMDRNEKPAFKSRLYYLEDADSAFRYAHATLFERFHVLKNYFPIQSHVEQLHEFLSEHRQFLVLSRPNWPENWLLPKLRDDGAKEEILGDTDIPYLDQRLYLVTLP